MNNMIDRASMNDCGCWLDGQRGHYIGRDTIHLAEQLGMGVSWSTLYMCDNYNTWCHEPDFPSEAFDEEVQDALDWLNDNIAPEGAFFEFDDGLYLSPIGDDC